MKKSGWKYVLAGIFLFIVGFSGHVHAQPPPSKIQGVSASKGVGNGVTLKWRRDVWAQFYYIKRSANKNGPFKFLDRSKDYQTRYQDSSAQPRKMYFYQVKGCVNYGGKVYCGPTSRAFAGWHSGIGSVSRIEGVAASKDLFSDRIALSWNADANAAFYNVKRATTKNGNYVFLARASTSEFSDLSAAPGKLYFYQIKGCNSAKRCGPLSRKFAGSRAGSPSGTGTEVPTGLRASDGSYGDRVALSWNSVPGATRYRIERRISGGGAFAVLGETQDTKYSDKNAIEDLTYDYRVQACNAVTCGSFSQVDTGYRSGNGGCNQVGRFSSLWTTGGGGGYSYAFNQNLDEYNEYSERMKSRGYRPLDIEVAYVAGSYRYTSLWATDYGSGWALAYTQRYSDFSDFSDRMKSQGLRPADIEITYVAGSARYTSLWVANEGVGWSYGTEQSLSRFNDYAESMKNQGYRPVDIEVTNIAGALRYSSIWITNDTGLGWSYVTGRTGESFDDYVERMTREGYRPVDIEVTAIAGSRRYSGLWLTGQNFGWAMQFVDDSKCFDAFAQDAINKDYRPVDLEFLENSF